MINILFEKLKLSVKSKSFPATPDLKKNILSKVNVYSNAGKAKIRLKIIK